MKIADGSQTSGERGLGQAPRFQSYGKVQYIVRQGRPEWISGNCTAVSSEKIVSTSAARVTGRRHSAWVSRRMAETMIPAWLTPIQNTKLTIRKPQ